jgi:subtilisin family serine protease
MNLQRPNWSSHHWDWRALQDESGFVDVILWTESTSNFKTKISQVESELGYDTSDGIECMSSTSSVFTIRETYSISFSGFSAKIKLDLLQELLASDPSVQAYPDLQVNATALSNIQQIGADQVWSRVDASGHSVTGYGVSVAVIDTGIDYMHPDLGGGFGPGYKVVGGYDFYNGDTDPMDDNGHGTHVAGTIAAYGVIKGVAPNATLYAYKVLGASGSGSMSSVVSAIDAALDPNGDGSTADHVDVISMSLGGQGSSDDPACLAVQRAVAAGVVVVVAAGNGGPTMRTVASPGLSSYAITVGAVDASGNLASFSSRGPTEDLLMKPEVSAPGVSIYSTVPYSGASHSSSTGYMTMSGTSMATPHISGSAALLIQLHPTWTPAQVKSALVTCAKQINESLWCAGSGEVWVPGAADASLFSSTPLLSYGMANGTSKALTITNSGSGATFATSSSDRFGLAADGGKPTTQWANVSVVSPASVTISSSGQASVTIKVDARSVTIPEGYYDGWAKLTSGSRTLLVPFGFMILSKVTVHVLDISGAEVFDPYGGVWVYDIPDAKVALGIRGADTPSPPATFLVPSGTYSVHALGHHLIYSYSDPYILSSTLTIGKFGTSDVYISMASAHKMQLNLTTSGGDPIYIKDYRTYVRHVGVRNISFDISSTDYSVTGSEIFALPTSMSVYVSNTQETVGISISGLSYSSAMWSFMELNWQHWYEYVSGTSTRFMMEASADLGYLLSWEYKGVTSSTPSVLAWDEGSSRTYLTKYDIPGTLADPWCNWGNHRASGGDAVFWMRRDTDTSLNPLFSGMTRKIYVKGVFTDIYYPGNVLDGFAENEMYSPDYDNLVRAGTISEIYLPNRNFLSPLPTAAASNRVGVGPFFSAVWTENTNNSMVLYQPLLRDQSGAKIGMMSTPTMYLYKNGLMTGITLLSEFAARPDAVRVVNLTGPGKYTVSIDAPLSSQVSNDVLTELGFSVPSNDRDPPKILGLSMSQKFVPGQQIAVHLTGHDNGPTLTAAMSWREAGSVSWTPLTVSSGSSGNFTCSIQTKTSSSAIDLLVKLTDSSGNYIQSTIRNASLKQVPIRFNLYPSTDTLEYMDGAVPINMTGYLTDASEQPLNSIGAVPIEPIANGKKVAMLLDEHMLAGSHTHDGTITFQWCVNPTLIFSGPNQSVVVTATVDLGIYQSVTITFTLKSIAVIHVPPHITLVSPANNSLIDAGRTIDISITDDGSFSAVYSIDGGTPVAFGSPWDVSTASWIDGSHTLRVSATDNELLTSTVSFTFTVDRTAPQVAILSPSDGSQVPIGSTLVISASDAHLAQVSYSLDWGSGVVLSAPYRVDMSSWSLGTHSVIATALDSLGHQATASVSFEIVDGTVVVSLVSPEDGSVIHSGIPVKLSVSGRGTITCTWFELGVSTPIPPPYEISTAGWSDGTHNIVVSASNNLGGSCNLPITMIIDDTPPFVTLVSPSYESFVTTSDVIEFVVDDPHFVSVNWTILGVHQESTSTVNIIFLTPFTHDGHFTLYVTAIDLAGNCKNELFSFEMDTMPPQVHILGAVSGGAIAPGAQLSVSASDEFLSTVGWGLDGSATTVISDPYEIDTSGFSSGWHVLNAFADDYSGKSNSTSLRLYVDTTPPAIVANIPDHFNETSTLAIVADITDDYAVSNASVVCELRGGGSLSIQMSWTGRDYRATIPNSLLWDGMGVYVHAGDTVGNGVDSPTEFVSAIASPSGDEGGDGGGGNHAGIISSVTSWFGLLCLLAATAAISIIAILIVTRRSREAEDEYEPVRPSGFTLRPQVQDAHKPAQTYAVARNPSLAPAMAHQAPSIVGYRSLKLRPTPREVTGAGPEPKIVETVPPTYEEDFLARELSELRERVSMLRQDSIRSMGRPGIIDQGAPLRLSGLRMKKLLESED